MRKLNLSLLTILLACQLVHSQTITASLEAIIQDTSGGAIPGARIRIVNIGTNVATVVEANAEGRAFAASLQPGSYSIDVEAAGFKKLQRSGIVLQVNQVARIQLTLEVGAVTEVVEVTGEPPLLEASSSSVGQVVDNKRILDLPLNQRNPYALIFLVPGVTGSTTFHFIRGANFTINGGRHGSNEVLLDGVPSAPSQDQKNVIAIFPSVDAVEEFRVQTNNYSAEFGRSGGGIINLIYKSGANQFHGSVFEFFRNSVLDANSFFANSQGIPLASFKRNQFGGSAGGPLIRNRTFFFASYEGLRERSASTLITTLPTDLVRRGDFSQTRTGAGQLITIYDPVTTTRSGSGFVRSAFPGNRIPDDRFDPVARNVLRLFPAPNSPGLPNSGQNNFVAASATPQTSDQGDIKIDHNFSESRRMFGRYSRRVGEIPPSNFFPEEFRSGEAGSTSSSNNNSAVLDYTWTRSASFLINLRYGYTRILSRNIPRSVGFDMTTLGLPAYLQAHADLPTIPGFGPAGYYRVGHGGVLGAGRIGTDVHTWQGAATKVTGRHAIKFGAEARSFYQNTSRQGRSTGDYNFGREFTQGPDPLRATATAGEGFASFLLGLGTGTQTKAFKIVSTQNSYFGAYVGDDWKVTRRLTLNMGIRWELEVPRTERYDRTNVFDRNIPHPLAGPSGIGGLRGGLVFLGVGGFGRRHTQTDANNFSPRFGFAYQVGAKTLVRGAYGIFYAPSAAQGTGTIGQTGYRADTPLRGTVDGVTPYAYLRNPFPDGFLPVTGNTLGLMTFVGQGVSATSYDTASTYLQNWNFGIQRELPGAIVIDASYVASRGIQLVDQGITLNQLRLDQLALGTALNQNVANPFFGLISSGPVAGQSVQRRYLLRPFPHFDGVGAIYYTGASSTYHSFQLKAEKRFSKGLGLLVAYTNGKLLDDASQTDGNVGREGTRQNYNDRRSEWSLSTYDVSQRLVMSFVYDLPFGRGKSFGSAWNPAVNALLGGWQVNGITTFQRGLPLPLSAANNSQAFNSGVRPNNNGKSAEISGPVHERLLRYFDTGVFSQPATYTIGNVSRTLPDVRSDGIRNFEMSAFKQFRLRERLTLQFPAEFFNVFNTPQFGEPATAINAVNFGTVSSQANSPRQTQFGLKFLF